MPPTPDELSTVLSALTELAYRAAMGCGYNLTAKDFENDAKAGERE